MEHRKVAFDALMYWDQKRIDIDTCVVLDDHAHAVFRHLLNNTRKYFPDNCGTGILPVEKKKESLSKIQHSIKSFSSKEINKLFGKSGSVWQDESFDRVIRDENEWLETIEYVIMNPVKKGLCDNPESYQFLYVKNNS